MAGQPSVGGSSFQGRVGMNDGIASRGMHPKLWGLVLDLTYGAAASFSKREGPQIGDMDPLGVDFAL